MADNFKQLKVWQSGMALAKAVYSITKNFPKEEVYGLTSQIRKSAVSVVSNIAEGSTRRSQGDFIRFLNISIASLAELETQLILSEELGYRDSNDYKQIYELINEVGKMTNSLRNKLEISIDNKKVTTLNYKPLTTNH